MCDPIHRVTRLCTACGFTMCGWVTVAGGLSRAEPAGNDVLSTAIAGPLAGVDEVVFAMRPRGQDPHWYANFGYWCPDPSKKMYADGGRLCRLNLRTGELKRLIDDPEGGVRDPQVHYDGKGILFSYRRGGQPFFHLYEINVDGTGLRQLTEGDFDDIEPTYLPDGDIIFCSSRCRRYVNCWYTHVATLHRCDANGQHIRMISSNNDHDNTPRVFANTNDGDYKRVLSAIGGVAEQLKSQKRFDMPDFVPNEHYLREMRRYGVLGTDGGERPTVDFYALDRAYWQTFWYRPQPKASDASRR